MSSSLSIAAPAKAPVPFGSGSTPRPADAGPSFDDALEAVPDDPRPDSLPRHALADRIEEATGLKVVGIDLSGGISADTAIVLEGEAGAVALGDIAAATGIDLDVLAEAGSDLGSILDRLTDLLATLQQDLDAGKAPDQDLVTAIEQSLEALATLFDIQLPPAAPPEMLAQFTQALKAADIDPPENLKALLGAIAPTLLEDGTALANEKLGEKLKALLAGLGGEQPATTVADPIEEAELKARLEALAAARAAIGQTASATTAPPQTAETEADPHIARAVAAGQHEAEASGTADQTPRFVRDDAPRNAISRPVNTAPVETAPQPAARTDATATVTPAQVQLDTSASVRPVQAGYQTSQQQLNLPQIAFEVVRQVNHGNTQFQIRLDPPELGRIDVRMEIDRAGNVNARLTVEKTETLDLMQRDQRALERALQQAGLDTSKTNLEFSLKQNPFAGRDQQQGDARGDRSAGNGEEPPQDAPPPTVTLYRGSTSARGLNLFV